MKHDKTNRTFDCAPTLTDSQVLQYCHDGYLQLKGVVTEKYSYWRTVPPTRDWKQESDFDFQTVSYDGHGVARYVAHMFYWLCGNGHEFCLIGGQAWLWSSPNQIGPSYGFGHTHGYLPNWRKNNPVDYAVG